MPNTSVNSQVVDAITTVNTAVIGDASGLALGMMYQAEAQAFALGMQNAVAVQMQMSQIGTAVAASAASRISAKM